MLLPLYFLVLCMRICCGASRIGVGSSLKPIAVVTATKTKQQSVSLRCQKLRRRVLYIRSGFWTPYLPPQSLEDAATTAAAPAKAAMHVASHVITHIPSGGSTAAAAATAASASSLLELLSEMPLSYVKVILQLLLTTLNVGCWIVPLRNKNFTKNDSLLSAANCFAGGIFIMLGFGHLLPHSIEKLHSIGADINQAFYYALTGYLAIFAIEKIVFDSHAIMHSIDTTSSSTSTHHHESRSHEGHQEGHSHEGHHEGHHEGRQEDHLGGGHEEAPPAVLVQHQAPQHKAAPPAALAVPSTRSAIILLLAMSIHSLVETMALGIAGDKTSAAMMATSVALHQPAESLALLVAFLKSGMPTSAIVRWLGLFSVVGPLGVCLGIYLSRVATPLVDAVVVAVTAGTFMYVGFTEVVGEEFEEVEGREKYVRFLALLGGAATIALITRYSEAFEHAH